MKKIVAMMLALLMGLSLVACSSTPAGEEDGDTDNVLVKLVQLIILHKQAQKNTRSSHAYCDGQDSRHRLLISPVNGVSRRIT